MRQVFYKASAYTYVSKIQYFYLQTDLKSTVVSVIEGLLQVNIVLKCCPPPSNESETYPSPFHKSQLSFMAKAKRGDILWTDTTDKVQVSEL